MCHNVSNTMHPLFAMTPSLASSSSQEVPGHCARSGGVLCYVMFVFWYRTDLLGFEGA